jgi:hypothetical protein
VVLLVFLVPILIGVFMLAMEQLEYELLGRRPQTPTKTSPHQPSSVTPTPARRA